MRANLFLDKILFNLDEHFFNLKKIIISKKFNFEM